MGVLIFVLYSAWAVYSGNKMVSGRIAWLEEPGVANKICKSIASLFVGYVIGSVYLAVQIVKIGIRITDGKLF